MPLTHFLALLATVIFAAGAALVPGMPSGGDSEIDLPLSALMR